MTEIERQIFRIEGDIYVLNMHLKNEQNPTKYDLPKPSDERQHCIAGLKTKIVITSYSIHYTKLYELESAGQITDHKLFRMLKKYMEDKVVV